MTTLTWVFIECAALFAAATLAGFSSSFRKLHLVEVAAGREKFGFLYRRFHEKIFEKHSYEGILFALVFAQDLTKILFTGAVFFLAQSLSVTYPLELAFIAALCSFVLLFILGDYFPRILGSCYGEAVHKISSPIASFFMFLVFPITYIALKLSKEKYRCISEEEPLTKTKKEIIEIIQRTKVSPELTAHEKNIIESVLLFKDRIAREVMVPRVDVFGLPAETPIEEAVKLIVKEGFSRIPVYRNNVDNIVGVLMYKDVLNSYISYSQKGNDQAIIKAPIESIQKSVLYTPETKKISNLLLEFKKKQVHLAIVVDEYGGTEGIVTIEDILEEIVGEIEDEYDEEEELIFPQSDGSWIVDARMSISDAEDELGIHIPQDGEYDTIGGYVFHCASAIPPRGYIIHGENFEMQITRSDERRVEKVRIKRVEQKGQSYQIGPENPHDKNNED